MNLIVIIAILASCLFPFPSHAAVEEIPFHRISVSFDTGKNIVRGTSVIVLREGRATDIHTGDLNIISVLKDGRPYVPEMKDGSFAVTSAATLEIVFEGVYRENPSDNNHPEAPGVVGEKGIHLSGRWYPYVEGPAFYTLKALLPEGFRAVSEAEDVEVRETADGMQYLFAFPHPADRVSLIAGRYREIQETFEGISLTGFFFSEDVSHAKTYFGYAKKYLRMYGKLLTPFPYRRLCIVENIQPGSHSRPTYIMVDPEMIQDPAYAEDSFRRAFLRQWFGHYIFTDRREGDWSGGLVAYLSDHFMREKAGEGVQYRKQMLTEYANYVNQKNDIPLRNFVFRHDPSDSAGYIKGLMIFHMLENYTGKDAFYNALKKLVREHGFRETSWDDLRNAFETESAQKLERFFDQWLNRKGLPSLAVNDPRVLVLRGTPTVVFDIVQEGEPYTMDLKVKIVTDVSEFARTLTVDSGKVSFEIPVQGSPVKMTVDGDCNVLRKLSDEEIPPLLSGFLGDEKKIILVSDEDREKYHKLISVIKGAVIKDEYEIMDEDIRTHSLLVFGYGGPVMKRLFGTANRTGDGFSLEIWRNPLNLSKVVAIASAISRAEVDMSADKILSYGHTSFVRFKKGKNVDMKTASAEQGLVFGLDKPVLVIQPRQITRIEEIIPHILRKPVIYIAERHTDYEDHKVQLKVIMNLHEQGRKFAIGMEMFQRPFQKVIDDYLAGAISEMEFLKSTEYFKRWQFDYHLYREIVEYAKAKNIPVIALNIWTEIVKKVSSEGLDSLSDIEKREIPESMNMSDAAYQEKLRDVFRQHQHSNKEGRNFENFYQAQILWDETMAHSIDAFLKKNPDYQMVVLAGTGHIMYDSGVPNRVHRLNGKEYVTIIPNNGSVDADLGDYLYSAESIPLPSNLKLGVVLKEKKGRVEVEKIVPGSIAKSAGIKEGDIVISLNDWVVSDIADVKIFMLDKKRGEKFTVRVMRKGFLSGYKEVVLSGTM